MLKVAGHLRQPLAKFENPAQLKNLGSQLQTL